MVSPCICPDEVGKVLWIEACELRQSLRGEDIQQMLLRLERQRPESPHDVGNLLWLALVSLHNPMLG